MKFLLLVSFVSLASAIGYHRTIGIPAADRVRRAEASLDITTRIVNGNQAQLGSYPYFGGLLIALDENLSSLCGSTLITDTKLVTAAHCWNDGQDQPVQMLVVLASTTLFSGGIRIATNQITVHEGFDPVTVKDDIAIITVPPVTFIADFISPIKLPEDLSDTFVDAAGQVVGFGMISDTEAVSLTQQLSYTYVTVRSAEHCAMFGPVFTTSMICTEGSHTGPCMGDSGGPLVYKNSSEDILIGVVSYGSDEGCTSGHPSVYTRVTSYIDWIKRQI